MHYEFASAENIGDRKEQQDRVRVMTHPILPQTVLAIVADGMGGHTGGAIASQAVIDAVETVFESFDRATGSPADWLNGMVQAAHERVAKAGRGFERDPRSTCVIALAQPGRVDWAHCGDSRLYLFRSGNFETRSEDHSLVEILLQQGKITEEEALEHPDRSRLFSCLGGADAPQIALGALPKVKPGDTVLLCSDGLWAYFDGQEMADLSAARDLTAACDRLVGLARKRGGGHGDNLSVAMIRLPHDAAGPGLLSTFFGARKLLPSPLEDARRFVVRTLHSFDKPEATDLAKIVQSCKTTVDIALLVPRCAKIIGDVSGASRASQFTRRTLGLLEET